jgi:dTDP-4-dehydrorhamnose reductase
MNILITGSNGQLGSELQLIMPRELPGANLLFTDIAELDLTDAAAVERFVVKNDVTHIVNCAAYTAVDRAEEEKSLCTAVNVDAVKNIALAAEATGARIIHISTDYVFDGQINRPYVETDKVNPRSHYGATKRQGEMALLALSPGCIIVRTAWLYSPFGHNFVKTIARRSLTDKVLRVVNDQVGTPTYAADLAMAIVRILRSPQWVEGVYHYTDEGVCSWYDFARAVVDLSGHTACQVLPISTDDYPTVATRPAYSVLNKQRIRLTYGVDTPHWFESLRRCIDRLNSQQ